MKIVIEWYEYLFVIDVSTSSLSAIIIGIIIGGGIIFILIIMIIIIKICRNKRSSLNNVESVNNDIKTEYKALP